MSKNRETPIEIGQQEFKGIGYKLIDEISDFFKDVKDKKVTSGESPSELQKALGQGSLPDEGKPAKQLLAKTTDLLFNHSLFNGHPKFMGYITSSPAPIGTLADLLAATANPNVGAQILSPIATEIEKQTIKWLSEFIGVSTDYGGVLVSGGNMANFTAFLAARTEKSPTDFKEKGFQNSTSKMLMYCSKSTHTWVDKAAVLFGHGLESVRWISTDAANKMNNKELEQTIKNDLKNGHQPFMVIGTAGDVSTGAVDDLAVISAICKTYNLWFHVDGAYGIPAAVIPKFTSLFSGVADADSIALDPHKWLYSPLEAGCTLVKDPNHLINAFSSNPVYYNFNANETDRTHNFFEYGLQNSRGFRALKVWLALQQVGKNGYVKMIGDDIKLSEYLFELADKHENLEAVTQNLSIATFRFIPSGYDRYQENALEYLNALNEKLLNNLQMGGEVFLSNAVVENKYCLRGCIVNFRTTKTDIEEIIEIVVREGLKINY